MLAVIFEVKPKSEAWDSYLGYAKQLRPELERIDGFLDNERFSNIRRPGWLLSLSTWRDESSAIRWRAHAGHREVQQKARAEVFRDYRLRVGEIIFDSRSPAGWSVPQQGLDEVGAAAKLVILCEGAPKGLPPEPDAGTVAARLGAAELAGNPDLHDWDAFERIYQPGKFVLLTSWRNAAAAQARPVDSESAVRRRGVRVIRDYGMFDRAEAPQYYPPAPRESPEP